MIETTLSAMMKLDASWTCILRTVISSLEMISRRKQLFQFGKSARIPCCTQKYSMISFCLVIKSRHLLLPANTVSTRGTKRWRNLECVIASGDWILEVQLQPKKGNKMFFNLAQASSKLRKIFSFQWSAVHFGSSRGSPICCSESCQHLWPMVQQW